VRRYGVVAGAAVADREPGFDFPAHADFLQADDATVVFADAEQEDAAGAVFRHGDFRAGDERHPAPSDEWRPEKVDDHGRDPPLGGLAAESGDRPGVSEEKGRLFPNKGEEFVEVVRRRRAGAGFDPPPGIDFLEQAELGVVQDFMFLALLDGFDGQPHLLAQLVDLVVVEVGDARMGVQHGGDGAEFVFAGVFFVVHEGRWQRGLAAAHGGEFWKQAAVLAFPVKDLVHAVGAAVYIHIRQEVEKPARSDEFPLGNRDRGGGEVAGRDGAQALGVCFAHRGVDGFRAALPVRCGGGREFFLWNFSDLPPAGLRKRGCP